MTKALLRLAAVWDTKQTGDLRGDTVQLIASSSALVLMMQNGNIYRPLTQTATCPLPRYSSKHIAENSQWVRQTTNSLTALVAKRARVRLHEVVNTSTERRAEKRIQRTAWILSHVLHTTTQRRVNMWTVCAQPDGSMSSLLQRAGSSSYILVHKVGPMAATTSPPF